MTPRVIITDQDLRLLHVLMQNHKRPFTVSIRDGAKRSVEQNRLQRLWLNEASDQLGYVVEELRAEMKLTIGVPILRDENYPWREKYDRLVKPLPYPVKLEMMMEPISFPVTSAMTTKQKTKYLDTMCQRLLERGAVLTDTEGRLGKRVV